MTKKRIPAAGENYRVQSSVEFVRRGEHDVGSKSNIDLPNPGKAHFRSQRDKENSATPEYTENINPGGRTKIKVEVPANKPNNSNPQGARPDSNPDWANARSTSGPIEPKGKPTGLAGAGPRHPDGKLVTSTPDGGPRQGKSGGKPKDSINTSDANGRPSTYGNRSAVTNPTVRRRSDVVPSDSAMNNPDHNPKAREGNYYGISRDSLKDSKKLKK